MVRIMSNLQFMAISVGGFLVRRIPAVTCILVTFLSFMIASAATISDSVSSMAIMFIGLAMAIIFAIAGIWFAFKAPENVREFFKDRLYGTLLIFLPVLLGVIAVGLDSDFPMTNAGMFVRYFACVLLAAASGIAAFFLVKGERI